MVTFKVKPTLNIALVNDVRAIRLFEIMQDYRNLQHFISQIKADPAVDNE